MGFSQLLPTEEQQGFSGSRDRLFYIFQGDSSLCFRKAPAWFSFIAGFPSGEKRTQKPHEWKAARLVMGAGRLPRHPSLMLKGVPGTWGCQFHGLDNVPLGTLSLKIQNERYDTLPGDFWGRFPYKCWIWRSPSRSVVTGCIETWKGTVWIQLLEKNSESWLRESERGVHHSLTPVSSLHLLSPARALHWRTQLDGTRHVHARPPLRVKKLETWWRADLSRQRENAPGCVLC